MKSLMAVVFTLAACGGTKSKPESPLVNEGSGAKPEACCCKSTPMTSVDGKPVYEMGIGRMECSGKQGDCVDEVQCNAAGAKPAETPTNTGGDTNSGSGAGDLP